MRIRVRFVVGLLGVFGLAAWGCGPEELPREADREEIRRPVVIQDLIEGPREGSPETWPERQASRTVEAMVPRDSFLRLAGRAWVTGAYPDESLGPVTFAVEANGDRIFERDVRHQKGRGSA